MGLPGRGVWRSWRTASIVPRHVARVALARPEGTSGAFANSMLALHRAAQRAAAAAAAPALCAALLQRGFAGPAGSCSGVPEAILERKARGTPERRAQELASHGSCARALTQALAPLR